MSDIEELAILILPDLIEFIKKQNLNELSKKELDFSLNPSIACKEENNENVWRWSKKARHIKF